jgi:hypothetical protein
VVDSTSQHQDLSAWFAMPDTPAVGSPVGRLIQAIVEKNPGIGFEDARAEAHVLLGQAAGRTNYKMPPVLSPAEKEAARDRLKAAFRAQKAA